jgi:hypothetical protein
MKKETPGRLWGVKTYLIGIANAKTETRESYGFKKYRDSKGVKRISFLLHHLHITQPDRAL